METNKPVENGAPPSEPAPELFDPAKLVLPEGMKAEGEVFDKFVNHIKETGLTTAQASALIGMHAEQVKSLVSAFQAQQADAWKNVNEAWVKEIRADPEIGGDKLEKEVVPAISSLINEFGGPEVRTALNLTGAGNNPALTRFLFKVASALSEGRHVQGNPPAAPPKTAAQILYPNHTG